MDTAHTLNVVFKYIPGYWLLVNACFNNGGAASVLDGAGGKFRGVEYYLPLRASQPALAGPDDNRMAPACRAAD
jgi:hypothetical protein